jgi:hypothetical protein
MGLPGRHGVYYSAGCRRPNFLGPQGGQARVGDATSQHQSRQSLEPRPRLRLQGMGSGSKAASVRPTDSTPPFENSFWVAPGLMLAGPYPGDVDPETAEAKIDALVGAGIRCVVNLQPEGERGRGGARFPDLVAGLAKHGISCVRYPISDMAVPSRRAMATVLDAIDLQNARGNAVYVHCWVGHGRTGTVVGCWLQRHGLAGPSGPLARLRDLRAAAGIHEASPQTDEQRLIVMNWPSPDSMPFPSRLAGGL